MYRVFGIEYKRIDKEAPRLKEKAKGINKSIEYGLILIDTLVGNKEIKLNLGVGLIKRKR